jgi:hypothetical protein
MRRSRRQVAGNGNQSSLVQLIDGDQSINWCDNTIVRHIARVERVLPIRGQERSLFEGLNEKSTLRPANCVATPATKFRCEIRTSRIITGVTNLHTLFSLLQRLVTSAVPYDMTSNVGMTKRDIKRDRHTRM